MEGQSMKCLTNIPDPHGHQNKETSREDWEDSGNARNGKEDGEAAVETHL